MSGIVKILITLSLLLPAHMSFAADAGNRWVDSISLITGTDDDSLDSDILGIGIQNQWQRKWFTDGAWYVGGYWDLELSHVEVDTADNNDLLALGITPVLRMQRDASLSNGVSPYAEAGLGAHLLTDTRLGDLRFATAFQFASTVGLGLGFGTRGQYELSYRFRHLSNADIKTPNDDLNLHMVRLGYAF